MTLCRNGKHRAKAGQETDATPAIPSVLFREHTKQREEQWTGVSNPFYQSTVDNWKILNSGAEAAATRGQITSLFKFSTE